MQTATRSWRLPLGAMVMAGAALLGGGGCGPEAGADEEGQAELSDAAPRADVTALGLCRPGEPCECTTCDPAGAASEAWYYDYRVTYYWLRANRTNSGGGDVPSLLVDGAKIWTALAPMTSGSVFTLGTAPQVVRRGARTGATHAVTANGTSFGLSYVPLSKCPGTTHHTAKFASGADYDLNFSVEVTSARCVCLLYDCKCPGAGMQVC